MRVAVISMTCHIAYKTLKRLYFCIYLGRSKISICGFNNQKHSHLSSFVPDWSGLSDRIYIRLQCVSESIYTRSFQDRIAEWPGVNCPIDLVCVLQVWFSSGFLRSRVYRRSWRQFLWVPDQILPDVRQDGSGGQEDVLQRHGGTNSTHTTHYSCHLVAHASVCSVETSDSAGGKCVK